MRKAFDCLDHKWILRILREYGMDPALVDTLEMLLSRWETILTVQSRRISEAIPVKSGIFQGYSLSPLLSITALNPISWRIF
jgi:hypothetical protein